MAKEKLESIYKLFKFDVMFGCHVSLIVNLENEYVT